MLQVSCLPPSLLEGSVSQGREGGAAAESHHSLGAEAQPVENAVQHKPSSARPAVLKRPETRAKDRPED